MGKKIVIIGAGSMAFTPALITAFTNDKRYSDATIGLVDVNEESLNLMHKLTLRLAKEKIFNIKFEASTNRRDLLPGADIVTVAIAVGGNDAFAKDILIPSQYGFVQPVGDTSGPGGLVRALRHIPVMLDIANDIKELCPNAHFYNFTNPMTILTQAVTNYAKIPCTGLCIGVELTWHWLCEFLDIDYNETQCFAAGLNHCHWVLDFRHKGKDLFPLLKENISKMGYDDPNLQKVEGRRAFGKKEEISIELFKRLGYFPGPGDGHVSEFFPQFLQSTAKQRKKYPKDQEYYSYIMKHHPGFMEKVRNQALGITSLDEKMFSKETAWEETQLTDIEASMEDNLGKVFHINIPNKGYITNMPEGTVVEVPVMVDSSGYHPMAMGDLPASIVPTLARQASRIDLIIEASIEGSREKVISTFINDPYCFDIDTGARCINEMIDAQLDLLPAFRRK